MSFDADGFIDFNQRFLNQNLTLKPRSRGQSTLISAAAPKAAARNRAARASLRKLSK